MGLEFLELTIFPIKIQDEINVDIQDEIQDYYDMAG